MDTVTYNGREYQVEATGNESVPYHLHGSRGANYGLIRNRQNPDVLFLVTSRMRVLDGWFTDRGGVLKQL